MESSSMEFGDAKTADVSLTLMSRSKSESGPFHLHSTVICKSDFFKAQLSETWACDTHKKPAQIVVKDCEDASKYRRFFELLYMPDRERHFCSVEDAIDVLEVAARLLCNELIDCCMKYVEAVPWTPQQEQAIRSCISFLNLNPSADLDRRLSPPACHVIAENLLENLHKALADLKGAYKAKRVGSHSKAMWLVSELQRLNAGDEAINFLAGERELATLVGDHVKICSNFSDGCRAFLSIINRLFGELRNGHVVVSRTVRVSLVTSWFHAFSSLDDQFSQGSQARLDGYSDWVNSGRDLCVDWLECVLKSLPLVDQHKVILQLADSGELFRRISSSYSCEPHSSRKAKKDRHGCCNIGKFLCCLE